VIIDYIFGAVMLITSVIMVVAIVIVMLEVLEYYLTIRRKK
jgi:hypothetical protein